MNPEVWLLPGKSIELLIPDKNGNDLSMRTLVEKGVLYGEFRIIAPIYQSKVFIFNDVDTIKVIYNAVENDKKTSYEVDCTIVSKLRVDDIPIVTLSIVSEPKKVQRRQAFRVNVVNTMKFSYEEEEYELITKDISLTGMLIVTDVPLEPGKKMRILWESTFSSEEARKKAKMHFLGDNTESQLLYNKSYPVLSSSKSEEDKGFFDDDRFVIVAKVLSKSYDKTTGKYECRLAFEELSDFLAKKVLKYLYKKQSEQIKRETDYNQDSIHVDYDFDYMPQVNKISVLTLISLSAFIIGVVLFFLARPEDSYGIDNFFDVYRPMRWSHVHFSLSIYILSLSVILEGVALVQRIFMSLEGRYVLKLSTFLVFLMEVLFLAFIIMIATKNNINFSPISLFFS